MSNKTKYVNTVLLTGGVEYDVEATLGQGWVIQELNPTGHTADFCAQLPSTQPNGDWAIDGVYLADDAKCINGPGKDRIINALKVYNKTGASPLLLILGKGVKAYE